MLDAILTGVDEWDMGASYNRRKKYNRVLYTASN